MGNICSCKDIIQTTVPDEGTVPREKLALPGKVQPTKKRYRKKKRMLRDVQPSGGSGKFIKGPYGNIGNSSSSSEDPSLARRADYRNNRLRNHSTIEELKRVCIAEKSRGPADDTHMFEENTEDDLDVSYFHKASIENELSGESSLGSSYAGSSDTDDMVSRDDPTIPSETSLDSLIWEKYYSVLSVNRQMNIPQVMETRISLIKIQSRKQRFLNAIKRRVGLRPTESSNMVLEKSTVDMARKPCAINEDLHGEERMEATPLDTEVQTRKYGFFASMLRKLGISCSVLSCIRPLPSTVILPEEAHGPKTDISGNINTDLSSHYFLKSKDHVSEMDDEQTRASGRQVTPPLTEVRSKRWRCFSAVMKRLGCEDMHSQKEPDINLLQSAEKARSTNVICEQNKMKASQKEDGKSSLVVVQPRKRRIFALLKSLGLRRAQDHEYSGTPQKKSVLRGEKACGTTEDIDTFEESTDDDLDIDHVDDDDVENELEIHNTYEDNSENDLGSVTSVHTFELDTDSDSDEMKTVPVGPIQEDKDVEKGPFLTWRDGPACKGQGHKNIIGSDC
eukprot:XP_017169162.1 PREDICTED: uncharacterized protein LOC75258 isoform X3 [Mus musculus]